MCSYCGCRATTVIGRLSDQHDAIVDAVGAMRRTAASGDGAQTRVRVAVLAELLERHTADEERGLFAELRTDPEFATHVDALCREHEEIAALLAAVAGGDLDRVEPLERLLRRHIDREDNGLFPAAVIALDGPAWERVVAAVDPAAGLV